MARAFLLSWALCLVSPSFAAVVDGQVRYAGKVPAPTTVKIEHDSVCKRAYPGGFAPDNAVLVDENGGLANAFIVLTAGVDGRNVPPVPPAPVAVDQKDCQFLPRVVGIRAGQKIRVGNGDHTLHNVRSQSAKNTQFNLGLAPGKHVEREFSIAERMVPLHCHVHPWMTAWVGVVDHPYFAVSDRTGRFRIENVPAGRYTVEAWHEKFGIRTETIVVDRKGTMHPLRFAYGNDAGRTR